jgi:hypothetical protein
MNKKLIRLTESDLHRIVKESVQKALKEDIQNYRGEFERQVMKWEGDLEDIAWYIRETSKNPTSSKWGSTASQEELNAIRESYQHIENAYMILLSIVERFVSYNTKKEPDERPFGFADEEY